ncbi:MAG: hypothetical protein JWN75_229 [Candidatus Saccharibacteria bacterium]|nr:hypothetical protein [Candidatus Saccharibacteria bacterium]
MNYNKLNLRKNIEQGIPVSGFVDGVTTHELSTYVKGAEEASLNVHTSLYLDLANNDPRVMTFGDNDSGEKDKYVSYKDNNDTPLFGPWDPEHPSTDIGIRGVNPAFNGVANPTTVVHADTLAVQDFIERGSPQEVIDAIDAVARLNRFVEDMIAKPYLEQVADVYNIDPKQYTANFFAEQRGRREQILTRVIMYHLVAAPGQRPVSSDGTPLLIKEHNDRGSWTFDHQKYPGLQYMVDNEWHNATTEVTAFRGAADSYLSVDTPPTLHRAVEREHVVDDRLARVGIGRIAVPTFVSPIHENARIVRPSSAETHPTEVM